MKWLHPERFQFPPEAILLDLDNTLYDYPSAHDKALLGASKRGQTIFGIDHDSFLRFFHEGKGWIKKQLHKSPSSHHRLLYFLRMTELIGGRTNPLAAIDLEQAYWSAYLSGAKLYPWVREFLDTVRSLAIPLLLVTNLNTHIQLRKLLYFQIEELFDFIVTSEEAGADKPEPPLFQLALAKLKTKPTAVWMIGDDPICDMRGAKEAIDATTLQWDTGSAPIAKESDASFHSWKELLLYVEGYNRNATVK